MNILFIGDIVGKIGRKTVGRILPKLKKGKEIDFVIANAENAAHGSGMTVKTVEELLSYGVDFITSGDHAYKRLKQIEIFDKYPVIAPANFSRVPISVGYKLIKINSKNILIINLIGRVFMKMPFECPFYKLDEILANFPLPSKNLSAIIVDMHAEATSEKICFGYYADKRISAVLGTHTHIMTADHKITKNSTAYITDVGMTGMANGSLGLEKEDLIKSYLDNIKRTHIISETGKAIFNAVLISIDEKSGKALKIKPITKFIEIKN
ncbi:YmdB family metallophosphoesterase [Candidatus Parcubacteria bacterium]|nr:YmdB family metallophosphoesterase [Candidatus Parcubacteria bacterium]